MRQRLGAIHVHSDGDPFTALAMVPPHLVDKWAREAFLTLPGIRVFLIACGTAGTKTNSMA